MRAKSTAGNCTAPQNSWQVVADGQGGPSWIGKRDSVTVRARSGPDTNLWQPLKSGFISMLPLEKY